MASPLSIALSIAKLLEDNSERDIVEAVRILNEHGVKGRLLEFMARSPGSGGPQVTRKAASAGPQELDNTVSLAVRQLRESDPQKSKLLQRFDQMLRHGKALPTFEDLKRFAENFGKEFEPRKSRKDTISPLISQMADLPLSEIERLIEIATRQEHSSGSDDYQRLATFLIKGKPAG